MYFRQTSFVFALESQLYKLRLNIQNRYSKEVAVEYGVMGANEVNEIVVQGSQRQLLDLFYPPHSNGKTLAVKFVAFDHHNYKKLLINSKYLEFARPQKKWQTMNLLIKAEGNYLNSLL